MASWAQILDKATEYIQYMQRKNHTHQQDIDDLKRQDALLEQQVRALEKARSSAQLQTNYPSSDNRVAPSPSSMWVQTPAQSPEPEEPQQEETPYGGQLSHAGQGSNKTVHHFLLQFIIRTLRTIEKTLYFPFLFIVILHRRS